LTACPPGIMKRISRFLLVFLVFVLGTAPGLATMFWRPAEAAMGKVYEILDPETPDVLLPDGLSEDILLRIQESGRAMPLSPAEYPSEQLSTLAWEALEARDIAKVEAAVFWCLEIYGEEARKLQAEFEADDMKYLNALQPSLRPMRPLVYVGEALFALGEAYRQAGRQEEALVVYSELIHKYYFSATERR